MDIREVVNALFYRNREGCTWRALPHDFPPWKTVYNYFQWWHWDGTWDKIYDKWIGPGTKLNLKKSEIGFKMEIWE